MTKAPHEHGPSDPSLNIPGLRSTKQRTAVAELLNRTNEFKTAQELHETLRDEGADVGLTTVYRTVQAMADAGRLDVVRADDGESMYRRCSGPEHHHHLVCRSCGRTVEVDGPDVERWADDMAARNGFTAVSHTIEIFGTCGACAGPTKA